jgi:tetratricopeptide (TPR) repeat protein
MKRKALVVFALSAAIALAADAALVRTVPIFPPLSELPATPFTTRDAALASAGLRSAAADLAWIQLLQYAGHGLDEIKDGRDSALPSLQLLTQRVVRLDPSFRRAYLFGASILAWAPEVNRPDQAVELLEECLRRQPGEKLCSLYLGALAFQRKGDAGKMITLLESTLDDPRAPVMMRPLLANIYKERKDYLKALKLWEIILDDERAPNDHARAVKQIGELKALLGR